jgi:methyltransferase (TIGR00027 family)
MGKRIQHFVSEGVRQIVILAAGMDTRSFWLNLPKETVVFELDRREVFDYKNKKLGSVKPICVRQTLPVDLCEEWQEQLKQVGFKLKKRTLWLIEGLLMYLEEPQVNGLFDRLNSLASPKDVMLFDILTNTLLEAPCMQKQLDFLASIDAPWRFGTNDPENFIEGFVWRARSTQPGEFAPMRWPFPTAPRSVLNVPRGFYIEALKY